MDYWRFSHCLEQDGQQSALIFALSSLALLVNIAGFDASGLLKAIKEPTFVFRLEFLCRIILLVNAASEALQNTDMDLAAATTAIEKLKTAISNIDRDEQFHANYSSSIARCEELDINTKKPTKRRKQAPAALTLSTLQTILMKIR